MGSSRGKLTVAGFFAAAAVVLDLVGAGLQAKPRV
jgi:hypothetical protein